MSYAVEFDCDFCRKRVVSARQHKRLFPSSVENKKCQAKYSTVKEVYILFHKINKSQVDPSARVMCRKCTTLLESLAVKFEEAKNAYKEKKVAKNLEPPGTYFTHRTQQFSDTSTNEKEFLYKKKGGKSPKISIEEKTKYQLKRKRDDKDYISPPRSPSNKRLSNDIKEEPIDDLNFEENKNDVEHFGNELIAIKQAIKQELDDEEVHPTDTLQVFLEVTETKAEPTNFNNYKLEVDQFMKSLGTNPLDNDVQPPITPMRKPTLSLFEVVTIVEKGKVCPECPDQEFSSSERLVDHMFFHHLISDRHPGVRVKCPFPKCPRAFPYPSVMRTHYNRCHKPEQLILSAFRCMREGCGFHNRVMGLLCSKEHLAP